ncbi:anaerobic coproporphyrinogen III oxidase [Hypnocyclicus thermotrophus]|uniref:Anaerobic coproporphyrinogen III oxidase n=1 Tax=Hypnocyclicus thermotrophus TaxID=1627895 RepID=A0AA46I4W7_9FUSO|nr:coproporphyrinogen III oxidase [Hypnocyclicus thermotrophus]TDT67936.1 anaerobic coproporphyrinogen III oxidase [Hypnocyclicus thermotrophus]
MFSIKRNFEIREESIKEFVRILIPELLDKEIEFKLKYIADHILINTKIDNKEIEFKYKNYENYIEDQVIVMAKISLLLLMGKKYPWGGLIGVRPTKKFYTMYEIIKDVELVKKILKELYLLSEEKIELLETIFYKEQNLLDRKDNNKINVYIGIPFCPTKCKYCSFASYEIKSSIGKSYNEFVDCLLKEIEICSETLSKKKIESIYIGGGTPTTLTEEDLEKILIKINEKIDFTYLKEFTVEAGRIDTLSIKKLEIMKKYRVDRISINPQTFKEETLIKLNRYYNKDEFNKYYKIAKKLGFVINMDFILGLPGETTQDILNTLENIKKYNIENLTIHTLAIKRASHLYQENYKHIELDKVKIENKINEVLEEKKLKPYYMYRQKNTYNWGENIGYAVEGTECLFNMRTISEDQDTFGFGGGAITKKIEKIKEGIYKVNRIINPKDPNAYIKEFLDRLEKKINFFNKKSFLN